MDVLTREQFLALFPQNVVEGALQTVAAMQKPQAKEDRRSLLSKYVPEGSVMTLTKRYYMTMDNKFPMCVVMEHWLSEEKLKGKIKEVRFYKSEAEAFIDRSKTLAVSIDPKALN